MANAFNDEISYMTLFPDTEFNNLTEAYSVYGAGAYFVALMDIANKYVKPAPGVSEDLSLKKRRPDLWNLQVTQANIDNEVPYLEKVLDLLRKGAGKEKDKGFIPFNPNAAQVQTYLQANNTNLAALAPSFTKEGYGTAWAMAQIGLTQSDANVLSNTASAVNWYAELHREDVPSDPTTIFKIITGLNDEGILALVYNGIPYSKDMKAELQKLYINIDKDCLGFENNELTNLKDNEQLKRIQNFLILSKKTGWDYATLYAVLGYLDIKKTTIDADEINQLAQISYLTDKWGKTPAQVAVWASACAAACTATPSLQQQLVALSPIAQALNCPMELLLGLFSSPNNTFATMLNAIFELQVQKQALAKAGVGLPDYLTSLALAGVSILDYKTFKKWDDATQEKLSATQNSLSSKKPDDLEQLLFKQWVHEFCVFTGLKELETTGIIQGVFSQSSNDDNCFKNANDFFLKEVEKEIEKDDKKEKIMVPDIEGVRTFFNKVIPYILFIQKLNLDIIALPYIGHCISKQPKPIDKEQLKLYADFTFVYAQVNADQKSNFVEACWSSIGTKGLSVAFIKAIGFPGNFSDLYDSLFGKDTPVTISALAQLCDYFALAQSTALDAVKLYGYTQVIVADTIPAIPEIKPSDSRYTQYRTYHGQALEAERDYLVPIVLLEKYKHYSDINTPDHLSDFYLIDVEMSGIMDIAPMREATDAVQTYLMRCNRGLEQVTVVQNEDESKGISTRQWEWIPNFRIWQAERILETYPQNYLQPDVRSTATPQFKDMLNELQGTQLTNDKAETALLNYLDEWIDLINTDMVDAAAYKTFSDYFQKDVETLFLISKSKVKANTFYYAYKDTDLDTGQYHWAPWQEITAKINADTVSCIYAFNRLHIFWSEISSVTDTDPTVTNGKYTLYSITIKCIYHNIDGSWSTPQTITEQPIPFYLGCIPNSGLLTGTWGKMQTTNCLTYNHFPVICVKNTNTLSFYYQYVNLILIATCNWDGKAATIDVTLFGKSFTIYNLTTPDKTKDYEFNSQLTADGAYFIIVNEVNPNFPYDYTDKHWQKLGLIEVQDGDSNFIQVLFGPERDDKWKFPTMEYAQYNDSKLSLFETTIKECTGNKVTNTMLFPPISLDQTLQLIFVDKYFEYKVGSPLTKCRPIYMGNNITMNDWGAFVTQNYQDTLGLSAKGPVSGTNIFNSNLPENTITKYFAIRNHPGGFYMEANQTGYIFTAPLTQDLNYLNAISVSSEGIQYKYKQELKATQVLVERIFSTQLNQLRTIAHNSGMAVMSAEIQKSDTIGAPQTAFSQLQPDPIFVVPPTEDSDNKIDFNGAFGIYAREMYFHAPMAIAKLLANQLQYDDVRKWYNYVVDLSSKDNTWKYYDFKLPQIINVTKIGDFKLLINGCNVFPFEHDSYYIANTPCICINLITNRIHVLCCVFDDIQKKISAYLVNASLVDNYASWEWTKEIYAISWDSYVGCYVESGIEFVEKNLNIYFFHPNSSTNKMLLSSNDDGVSWLSPKTVAKILPTAQVQTIKIPNIAKRYVDSFDPDLIAENFLVIYQHWTITQYINFILDFADNEFRQETWESLSAALQLYFEAEDVLGEAPEIKDEQSAFDKDSANRTYTNKAAMPFGPPTNQTLKALWDRLNDRLYKLRNGLNINGERQMPSMYGSAIDPARLLLAAQNGGINPYDNSSLKANRSVYRFREMAPHTESLINLVVEFGGQLYSALVQKDNEQLQVLQATHQINMLNVVAQTYQYQIDEAASEIAALKVNLDSVANQKKYYDGLINKGVNTLESEALASLGATLELQAFSSAIRTESAVAYLLPNIFGLADGGMDFGSAIEVAASALNETSQALQTNSQILNTTSEYIRRAEEWNFQSEQAQYSIDQINASLASATLRLNIAQENLKQYNLQVSQANEVYNYLKNKFTSAELYNWMSGQMASLYFTAYQLANTSLHTLQEAYQYELDLTDNFIPTSAWNSMQKGLLTGETLKLALLRMHDAYLTKNKRRQEMERIVSLKKIMNNDFTKGIDAKSLNFNIYLDDLFDTSPTTTTKIKSIAVSIPAVVGPYETFGAILKNNVSGESITISRGIEDMGVFVDEMNDGRYLPFEGLVIEKRPEPKPEPTIWTLTFLETKDKNISDVILNIKFTVKQ